MSSFLALGPVSAAVLAALNVQALLTLAPGGPWDEVPRTTTFPNVMFEVFEQRQLGGFGTRRGAGAVLEVEIRVHVYSQYEGMKEAHTVMAKVLELLSPGALTIAGYRSIEGPNFGEATPLPDQLVAGVRVNELVSSGQLFVEEL